MATVRQSGGDYTTLAAALAASEAVIDIDQAWTIDDTAAATIIADTVITVSGDAKHPGYWDESLNHYRLVVSAAHALTLSGDFTATIDGISIEQAGTGVSDECFRCVPGTSDAVTIKNSILRCTTDTSQQDCIYTGGSGTSIGPVTIEQCMIYGAFRGGINIQNAAGTGNVKVNSCNIWGNGSSSAIQADAGGGIVHYSGAGAGIDIDVYNTICVGNDIGTTSEDYNVPSVAPNSWDVSYSIDGDGSIVTNTDGGTGNLANRTATANTSPGAGDWVILENITEGTDDLRLADSIENDALGAHSVNNAHGITLPANDIVGSARSAPYDVGAFMLVAVPSPTGGATSTGMNMAQIMRRRRVA